jgi:putative GTP pyrophosphokinase
VSSEKADPSEVAAAAVAYAPRVAMFKELAAHLDEATRQALRSVPHIDRIGFRAKDSTSFAHKALKKNKDGSPRYARPLEDVEDQAAGRVLVFFRRDIAAVEATLLKTFNRVEQVRKAPENWSSFAYESVHFVFIIPPTAYPRGWEKLAHPPTTFEMQVRTLFMHAWAEPQHDIMYKAKSELSDENKRRIAWAASNAWGGDAIFEQVLDAIAPQEPANNGD